MPEKVGLGALHTMDYENSVTCSDFFACEQQFVLVLDDVINCVKSFIAVVSFQLSPSPIHRSLITHITTELRVSLEHGGWLESTIC